ncbi:hypothetical protein ACIBKY_28870 [Nonomuraea sp. NPDC050394]|uniref:hypothetical protein n=1 Tax=Nonomuraea sp. NPDC050394 TaxID=3364363 RepID=UPI0037BDA75F
MMTTTVVAIMAGTVVMLALIAGVVVIAWRALSRCTPEQVANVLATLDRLARTMLLNRRQPQLSAYQASRETENTR